MLQFRLPGGPGRHRALAKAVSWRVVGTLDTFIWSLLISHQAFQASSITSADFLVKVPLYYVHERAWRHIAWAPDSHARSLVKALSFRVFAGVSTFLISLVVTARLDSAISITSAETITKIVLYYLHERGWRLIPWGRLEAQQAAAGARPATS